MHAKPRVPIRIIILLIFFVTIYGALLFTDKSCRLFQSGCKIYWLSFYALVFWLMFLYFYLVMTNKL